MKSQIALGNENVGLSLSAFTNRSCAPKKSSESAAFFILGRSRENRVKYHFLTFDPKYVKDGMSDFNNICTALHGSVFSESLCR